MSSFAYAPWTAVRGYLCILALIGGSLGATTEDPAGAAPINEGPLDAYSEWLGERLGWTVDETAAWLDSRFGNLHPRHHQKSFGSIRVVPLWVQHHGWETDTRVRAQVPLPNLHRRFHAAFGIGDSENFVTDRPILGDLEELALVKERFNHRSFLAGLGYSLSESEHTDVSLGAGVRVRFPLEPYVRARFSHVLPLGSASFVRVQETVYARSQRGVGSVTTFDYERVLGHRVLGRVSAFAHVSTWDERPEEYGGEVSLARVIDRHRVIVLIGFAAMAPKADVSLQDYGFRFIYRQELSRDRLYGEIHTGFSWPRYTLADERRASLNLGVGLELHFGERRGAMRGDFGSAE